ncbi:hypothetical protein [Rhizosphaericola mali]|uniref:Uncharacterized protein n=1 Tax=Rhizosphaericola mali TaxID=2545455 RepID=A0A5P2GA35_9BACT|nr:hypothetical protein [Rhizosphaericola mali]QES88401.1 hypothetical protein E0W69_006925 [Rhizosphaericola mali]
MIIIITKKDLGDKNINIIKEDSINIKIPIPNLENDETFFLDGVFCKKINDTKEEKRTGILNVEYKRSLILKILNGSSLEDIKLIIDSTMGSINDKLFFHSID